jgi:ABC-type transport system substrate-binding protein
VLAFPLVGAVAGSNRSLWRCAIHIQLAPDLICSNTRGQKIVLEANPGYRGMIWDFQPGDDPLDKEIVARMKGKKLPQIGAVEISIIEETQSRWLAFVQGQTDIEYQLPDVAPKFMAEDGKLRPEFVKKGIKLDRSIDPEITYTHMNMQEKIGDQPNPLGGFGKEKIALRRAIAMVQDRRTDQDFTQRTGDQG